MREGKNFQEIAEHKIDRKCRLGRTHDDFETFQIATDTPFVEMDSVLGRPGGKTLLTMQFNSCGMMWLFLRQRNTSQTVIDVFNELESLFGFDTFCAIFPVILTDNGSEFSNPTALEISPFNGKQRTRIFYWNPYSAYQKGHVENNHLNLEANVGKKPIILKLAHMKAGSMQQLYKRELEYERDYQKMKYAFFCCFYVISPLTNGGIIER